MLVLIGNSFRLIAKAGTLGDAVLGIKLEFERGFRGIIFKIEEIRNRQYNVPSQKS